MANIEFDEKKLRALKRAYSKANKEGKEQFEFEGQTVLVSYAKYMIEYSSIVKGMVKSQNRFRVTKKGD